MYRVVLSVEVMGIVDEKREPITLDTVLGRVIEDMWVEQGSSSVCFTCSRLKKGPSLRLISSGFLKMSIEVGFEKFGYEG